ncbi:B-cell lymphoma leukemia 10 [Octopus vulgaris]|uniref:B-cell lymphoma leukemia 10 n=2 Tax=Octopus TaxID=6643 RepID=A0AA36BUG1_OCTVU|nr:uncharacterized protein LOC115224026 [Octopus sinensis]XP_036368950.1 uncharacterized protein LOC115224026 [Octopus sinensis]CAI9739946.1 B-cell lymphoma leukemia 10 [Octopus vulgaris]
MNEEEILKGIKKEILQSDKDYISQHLKAANHYSFLQEIGVLTKENCDVIEKEASDKEKADKLLEIIISKGPSSFDYLCDALQHEDTQQFLLERLKQKFDMRKHFLLDVCAAKENKPRKVPTSLPIASIDLTSTPCVDSQPDANSQN